jgi:GR25 family glycosyltransferase involved in LPS biosynthesis
MHTIHPLALEPSPHIQPVPSPREFLQLVPRMDIPFDGDCAQNAGIDLPIIAINLPHRTDRWQTLCQRLAAAGLTRLIKAPAILGASLPDSTIAALVRSPDDITRGAPQSHLTLTPPAIGCFLSHLAVWRWMLDRNLPRLLVLEDDATPTAHFSAERFCRVVEDARDKDGLVFLGALIMGGLADRAEASDLARLYYFNGTFAYLITPAACRTLLASLLPMHAHIDHQISHVLMARRHTFPAWHTAPPLFEPDWSLRSDCYVPLSSDTAADRELGQIITRNQQMLLDEGRLLMVDPSLTSSS